MFRRAQQFQVSLQALLDVGMVAAAFALAYALRFVIEIRPLHLGVAPLEETVSLGAGALLVWPVVFSTQGLYDPTHAQTWLEEAWSLLKGTFAATLGAGGPDLLPPRRALLAADDRALLGAVLRAHRGGPRGAAGGAAGAAAARHRADGPAGGGHGRALAAGHRRARRAVRAGRAGGRAADARPRPGGPEGGGRAGAGARRQSGRGARGAPGAAGGHRAAEQRAGRAA